jgi:hypothetical protein
MRKDKLSEFIYVVHLEHESGEYGVYNFKEFYDRTSCMSFVESMSKNNPDLSLNVDVRPRFRKSNALTAS